MRAGGGAANLVVAPTMPGDRGRRKLVAMTEKRRVIVETDPDAKPIAGCVSPQDAPGRPFIGWLELISALDAALAPSPPVKEDR
jgi:hypothetical protein